MGNLKFEGKPSVYFEADRATFTVNLRALSEALLEFASEEQIPLRMASSDLKCAGKHSGFCCRVVSTKRPKVCTVT